MISSIDALLATPIPDRPEFDPLVYQTTEEGNINIYWDQRGIFVIYLIDIVEKHQRKGLFTSLLMHLVDKGVDYIMVRETKTEAIHNLLRRLKLEGKKFIRLAELNSYLWSRDEHLPAGMEISYDSFYSVNYVKSEKELIRENIDKYSDQSYSNQHLSCLENSSLTEMERARNDELKYWAEYGMLLILYEGILSHVSSFIGYFDMLSNKKKLQLKEVLTSHEWNILKITDTIKSFIEYENEVKRIILKIQRVRFGEPIATELMTIDRVETMIREVLQRETIRHEQQVTTVYFTRSPKFAIIDTIAKMIASKGLLPPSLTLVNGVCFFKPLGIKGTAIEKYFIVDALLPEDEFDNSEDDLMYFKLHTKQGLKVITKGYYSMFSTELFTSWMCGYGETLIHDQAMYYDPKTKSFLKSPFETHSLFFLRELTRLLSPKIIDQLRTLCDKHTGKMPQLVSVGLTKEQMVMNVYNAKESGALLEEHKRIGQCGLIDVDLSTLDMIVFGDEEVDWFLEDEIDSLLSHQ
jgi:hypothetical protein